MAAAEVRRLACLLPGAGVFIVKVKGADSVDVLKQAIMAARPEEFPGRAIQIFRLMLETNSEDVRRLNHGDATTRVREVMDSGEIDALATVDDVFGDAPRKGVLHLLVTAPGWSSTRKLRCVVPGSGAFTLEVKGTDNVDTLKQAIKAARPEEFPRGAVQIFRLMLETNSEDVRRLNHGDASTNVRSLTQTKEIDMLAKIDDVFGNPPREGVVHVLAINPAKPPRPALDSVLGKRARPHWDALNARLRSLKKSAKNKTSPLSKIAWNSIQDNYIVKEYTQKAEPISTELVGAVRSEVEKSICSIRSPHTEMECTCILFSLFRELFDSGKPRVKMSLQDNLRSFNNILEAAGVADFVFYRSNARVCVMEAKKVKPDEDGDEDGNEGEGEDENEDEDEDEETNGVDPKLNTATEMADGFAQALMGMELQNTFRLDPEGVVRGIVSNYTNWTFIRLVYPDGSTIPTVFRDEDTLVGSIRAKPTDKDLTRILGKIVASVNGA